jgi:hypothetical protein
MDWLESLPHKHKLFIAGNHELGWQSTTARGYIIAHAPSCTYLHCTGVEIDGVKFWGSPYQPDFHGWAFQMPRGHPGLKDHWERIPEDTDVLITHGPPLGFGDTNEQDYRFGDEDLLNRVLQVKPAIHCFGHAHHGSGVYLHEYDEYKTIFINAAVLDEDYKLTKAPVEVDIDANSC